MLMKRKWQAIFLTVTAVALLLVGAWALGWIPAQATYCEYNPYTEHEKCSVDQIATVVITYVGWFLNFISPAATWIATAVIGAYTIVLARVTGRQARLTRESIDLARAEFISSHRPRIVVMVSHSLVPLRRGRIQRSRSVFPFVLSILVIPRRK
jgi:hypothetical protein